MRNMDKEFIEMLYTTTNDPIIKDTCLKYLESGIMPKASGSDKRYVCGTVTVKLKARFRDASLETPVPLTVEYDRVLNLLSATTIGSDWEYLKNQIAYDGEEDRDRLRLNEIPGCTIFTKEIEHTDT